MRGATCDTYCPSVICNLLAAVATVGDARSPLSNKDGWRNGGQPLKQGLTGLGQLSRACGTGDVAEWLKAAVC